MALQGRTQASSIIGFWRRALAATVASAMVAASLLVSPLVVKSASATSSGYPVVSSCSGRLYFMIENGNLDCSDDVSNWSTVGATGQPLNALAYDRFGDRLISIKVNTNRLYSIALDGTPSFLGTVSGLPVSGDIVTGGDIDPATGLYYVNTAANKFYRIDLSTRVATNLSSSLPFNLGADIVVEHGNLWTINNDSGSSVQYLEGFRLSDFSVLSASMSVSDTGPAGAQWEDVAGGGDGIVWFANSTGSIHKSSGLSQGGDAAITVSTGLSFTIPIDGATNWTLLPINGAATRGDTQVRVNWDPSPTIDPAAVYTYVAEAYDLSGNYAGSCTYTTATDSGYQCTITGLTNGRPYNFTITATNQNNGSETTGNFGPATPATTPSVPLNVTASDIGTTATVNWDSSASNGGEPIDYYSVTAYNGDGSVAGTCTYTIGSSPENQCTVSALVHGTTYSFQVRAHNVIGYGPPGSPSSSLQLPDLPGAPNNVSGSTSPAPATISWTIPDSDGGAVIDSYTVTAYDGDGNAAGTCSYTGNDPSGTMSCTVEGLSPGTDYSFKVTAHNRAGTGPPSSPFGPLTMADLPSAPNNPSASVDVGSAEISWTVPTSDGGASIDGYTATAYDANGDVAGFCGYTGNNPLGIMSCIIFGLSAGADYIFKITAHNGLGNGPPSSSVGPLTLPDLPSAPNNPSASVDVGSAEISWTVPTSDGGASIDGYTATAYDANGDVAGFCGYTGNNPLGIMSCIIFGLSAGADYIFKITAHNGVGDGPPSSSVGPLTLPDLPSAPHDVTVTGGSGSVEISWTIPTSDGGASIDGYSVTAYDIDGNVVGICGFTGNNPSAIMSCIISGLINGLSYFFKVSAHNGVGDGPQSGSAGPVVPADVPSAPNGSSVTGGAGSASVSWTIPTSDGGASIDGYTVTAYDSNGDPAGSCDYTGNNPTGTMSCTISGLTNGSSYSFEITAHNRVGDGPASSPPAALVPLDLPSAPNSVTASADLGAVTISWTIPDTDGGASIDGYSVTAYDVNGNVAGSCSYTGNDPRGAMNCTVSGLSNGSTYSFEVKAHNSLGNGAPASPADVVTTPDLPGAPMGLRLSTVSGSVTISWTIPASDGGAAIDGYSVTAYDVDGNVAGSCSYTGNNPSGRMDCTVSNLTDASAYSFKVKAHNLVGFGPPSSPAGPIAVGSLVCVPGERFAMANGQFYVTPDLSSWTAFGQQHEALNAIGYSTARGYIYGIYQKGSSKMQLARVDASGGQQLLGRISGLPKAVYLAGDIDPSSGYYYVSAENHRLFKIDLSTRVATELVVPDAFPKFGADLAISGSMLWNVTTSKISGFDLVSGNVTSSWLPKGSRGLKIGGLTLGSNGSLIGLSNQNGRLFRFASISSGHVTVTSLGTAVDGYPNGLDMDLSNCVAP